jgi:predicted membrane channel-forming protein YqfA (hemolysin III family)
MSLVKAVDLPQGFHAYEYTLTGYRIHYSTKGAILSIFDKRHNEFWMIWTDILPCIYFSWLYLQTCVSTQHMDYAIHGLYFGVITSRIFSLSYHIFNCISVKINHSLLYLDMIGISNMVFGTPILYQNVVGNQHYSIYVYGIFGLYFTTVFIFLYCAVKQIDIQISYVYCQTLLVSLVVYGSIPLWIAPYSHDFMDYYVATIMLTFGYLFYASAIPERFMMLGAADGRIWNSHVIWHNFVTLAQCLYIQNSMTEFRKRQW